MNARIIPSTWIKEGCRNKIYYQTTRVIIWNLLRITIANAIMWCDIFHRFVGRHKKNVMEGNCRLNINIEGHFANLNCLFRYFKNMWPFLHTPISLCKNIFLPSCCRTEKLALSRKRRWFRWWHSPAWFGKFLRYHYRLCFPAIVMWYSRPAIMTMKALVPYEDEISDRHFLKLTFICKKLLFEKYFHKPISTLCWFRNLEG